MINHAVYITHSDLLTTTEKNTNIYPTRERQITIEMRAVGYKQMQYCSAGLKRKNRHKDIKLEGIYEHISVNARTI
ncbi:hypothetical protein AC249_AIPGENE15943 [Exaiptasia diaphana]|nr:hypothetical protein AC249_AIPGENE15943 [Exaiptasia diaphana]